MALLVVLSPLPSAPSSRPSLSRSLMPLARRDDEDDDYYCNNLHQYPTIRSRRYCYNNRRRLVGHPAECRHYRRHPQIILHIVFVLALQVVGLAVVMAAGRGRDIMALALIPPSFSSTRISSISGPTSTTMNIRTSHITSILFSIRPSSLSSAPAFSCQSRSYGSKRTTSSCFAAPIHTGSLPVLLAHTGSPTATSSLGSTMKSDEDGLLDSSSAAESGIIRNNDANEEVEEQRLLLSFLPNHGQNIPPQFRQLVLQATRQYMNGGRGSGAGDRTASRSNNNTTTTTTTLQDISSILKREHRSRDVPVELTGSSGTRVRADVTQTGEELDEICAELLSAAALYELPAEITLQLLSSPVRERALNHHHNNKHHNSNNNNTFSSSTLTSASSVVGDSSLVACQAVFAETGWNQVYFPNGLAVRPHRTYLTKRQQRNNNDNKPWLTTNFGWRKSVREARAVQAVNAAAQAMPPRRPQFQNRDEFLQIVQAQFDAEQEAAVVSADSSTGNLLDAALTFFPQQQQQQSGLYQRVTGYLAHPWRTLQRLGRKQYTALQKQGRAGVVAYCFFNFLYYTLGMLWQWPRIPAVPVAVTAMHNNMSATALLWRKAATVYAYLYAASQLVKLPKLIASVTLAPMAGRCLQFCRRRTPPQWVRNDTQAAALLIAVLMLTWLTLAAGLLSSDYAQILQQLAAISAGDSAGAGVLQQQQPPQPHFYLDRLVQLYGKVQPV